MSLHGTILCLLTCNALCHCEALLCGAVAISRKGNIL